MPALRISSRASRISESVTLAIAARAAELRRRGVDVVSLAAGEPDFGTPATVAEEGVRAITQGRTRYTAAAGIPELREAAAQWFERSFGLRYAPAEVMATAGAKPALHMGLLTLCERGDRVLIPSPYWVSYPDLVRVADAEPIELAPVPEQGFVHSGAQIAAAAREHGARGLILNYPNNPSGAVPTQAQLQEIVDAAAAHDLWILSDEIYGSMLFDGRQHFSPASLRGGRERTLVVNGGTKSHSLTGWRIGFLAGPAEVIAAAIRIQSQVLGNPCTISQHAAVAVCRGDFGAEIAQRMAAFDARRRFLVEHMNRIRGLRLAPPQGAFYALVDVRELVQRTGQDDAKLTERLLDEAHVAAVPGSAFAIPGFIRFSYAASMADLEQAVARVQRFVERL